MRPPALPVALLLAVLLAACGVTSSGAAEAGGFGGTGESRSEYHSEGGNLTVRFSIAIERGVVGVRIVSPSGVERFRASFGAGQSLARDFHFSGERGPWAVVLDMRDAEGSYEVEWTE